MRGRRVDGKKIRRLHGEHGARIRPSMSVSISSSNVECPQISSPPQHDTDKSQDVTSSATSATEQNTRNRTWYMTTASRSEREALYLESVESNKDPRDAGPRGKDPGRSWGKTRQSKEAENAFINPRSWPGRRTAMGLADEAVMVWVGGGGGGGGGKTVAVPSRAQKKKKSTGWPIRGGVKDKRWAHARAKRPSTRGPGPPRWPPPPRPIRRAQTSPGEGRRAGRACRGGMAGREAVRRRHSLQAMRSRSSDSAPVPRPRGANCGCPWLPGPARVSTTAHGPSSTRTENPVDVSLRRAFSCLLPTAAPGTTAAGTAGNVFLSVCLPLPPTVRHPPVPIQHRALPPSPPLPPRDQPGQPTSCSGRPISSRCPAVEQLDLDTVEPVVRRRHWRDVRSAMRRVVATPRRYGGAWSMEQGAWSHAGRRLGPGARWRERLPWTILPKR